MNQFCNDGHLIVCHREILFVGRATAMRVHTKYISTWKEKILQRQQSNQKSVNDTFGNWLTINKTPLTYLVCGNFP